MTDVAIGVVVTENTEGLRNTKTALDQFNSDTRSGFAQTKTAIDQFTSGGITGFESMRQKVAQLRIEYASQRQALLDLKAAHD